MESGRPEPMAIREYDDNSICLYLDSGKTELLRMSAEGFWVRGQKVAAPDAAQVYEAFKFWLWKANGECVRVAPQEQGWLIENAKEKDCVCVGENTDCGKGWIWKWTHPNKAVRFAREQDAMAMARMIGFDLNKIRIVCHGWVTTDVSK